MGGCLSDSRRSPVAGRRPDAGLGCPSIAAVPKSNFMPPHGGAFTVALDAVRPSAEQVPMTEWKYA